MCDCCVVSPTTSWQLRSNREGLIESARRGSHLAPADISVALTKRGFAAMRLVGQIDGETTPIQKRSLTRLVLALVAAIVCIGGSFWIASDASNSVSSAANLEREFSQERDRAAVAMGGLNAAQKPDNVALTETLVGELKQALDKSEARSEALVRELAQTNQLAHAREMELKAALDESEKKMSRFSSAISRTRARL
jgi:hypothetical protein